MARNDFNGFSNGNNPDGCYVPFPPSTEYQNTRQLQIESIRNRVRSFRKIQRIQEISITLPRCTIDCRDDGTVRIPFPGLFVSILMQRQFNAGTHIK